MKKNQKNNTDVDKNEVSNETELEEDKDKNEEETEEPTLEERIEILQKENEDLKEKRLRIAAEFENFRRRSNEEKIKWIKNATERLVLEICDVVDNFERALQHNTDKKNQKMFEDGVKLIYQQLVNVLKKEGVSKIEALKKDFDPNFHEALAQIPSKLKENKVASIIQNGYIMNGKIIRPTRVAVSNGILPEDYKNKSKSEKKISKILNNK